MVVLAFGSGLPTATGAELAAAPVGSGALLVSSDRTTSRTLKSEFVTQADYYAVNGDGSALRLVLRNAASATWSPDGRSVAFTREYGPCIETDGIRSCPRVIVVRGQDGRGRGYFPGRLVDDLARLTWSPRGDAIAFETQNEGIAILELRDGRVRVLPGPTSPPRQQRLGGWSSDGRRIVVLRSSGRSGFDQALVIDVVTMQERELRSPGGGPSDMPTWSPDGNAIAFSNGAGLFVAPSSRLDAAVRIPGVPAFVGSVEWSPDGKRIAFSTEGFYDLPEGLYVASLDGRDVRRVAPSSGSGRFAWSDDGESIAAMLSNDDFGQMNAGYDVYVIDVGSGAYRRVTVGGRFGYSISLLGWHPTAATVAELGGEDVDPGLPPSSVPTVEHGRAVLKSRRPVGTIVADGGRVLISFAVTVAGEQGCVESWIAPSAEVARLPIPCRSADGSSDLIDLGVAGSGTVWSMNYPFSSGNHFTVRVGTLGTPAGRDVGVCRSWDGRALPWCWFPLHDLIGDRDLVVFDAWTPRGYDVACPYAEPRCWMSPRSDGRLFRLEGDQAVEIAKRAGPLTPVDVDEGRILVDRWDGLLEVLARDGRRLHSIDFGRGVVREARLTGSSLVVQQGDELVALDLATSRVTSRHALPPGFVLDDADAGLAVALGDSGALVVRLADDERAAVGVPGKGHGVARDDLPGRPRWSFSAVELEPEGLFYAYELADPQFPGRVAFVPMAALEASLR